MPSEPLRHPALYRGQRGIEPARVTAAGHRQVGLAAALAADLLGDEADQFAGLDRAGLVGGHAGGELVNFVAQQVGGKGGGKADLAMAGGNDAAGLGAALASVRGWVAERI